MKWMKAFLCVFEKWKLYKWNCVSSASSVFQNQHQQPKSFCFHLIRKAIVIHQPTISSTVSRFLCGFVLSPTWICEKYHVYNHTLSHTHCTVKFGYVKFAQWRKTFFCGANGKINDLSANQIRNWNTKRFDDLHRSLLLKLNLCAQFRLYG